MVAVEVIISREDYDRIQALDPIEKNSAIKDMIPNDIRIGYGVYGCGIKERRNGECVLWYNRGDSCD